MADTAGPQDVNINRLHLAMPQPHQHSLVRRRNIARTAQNPPDQTPGSGGYRNFGSDRIAVAFGSLELETDPIAVLADVVSE